MQLQFLGSAQLNRYHESVIIYGNFEGSRTSSEQCSACMHWTGISHVHAMMIRRRGKLLLMMMIALVFIGLMKLMQHEEIETTESDSNDKPENTRSADLWIEYGKYVLVSLLLLDSVHVLPCMQLMFIIIILYSNTLAAFLYKRCY